MYRERRSNIAAGIFVVAGALVLAWSSRLPWARLTVPAAGVHDRALHLDAVPGVDLGGGRVDFGPWLLAAAGVVALLGLLLVITRVRGLGVVWRLGVLAVLLLPAYLVLSLWKIAVDPAAIGGASRAFWRTVRVDQIAALSDLGEIDVDGGAGLIVMVLGTICSFIGCCVPAVKDRPADPRGTQPPPRTTGPSGW